MELSETELVANAMADLGNGQLNTKVTINETLYKNEEEEAVQKICNPPHSIVKTEPLSTLEDSMTISTVDVHAENSSSGDDVSITLQVTIKHLYVVEMRHFVSFLKILVEMFLGRSNGCF